MSTIDKCFFMMLILVSFSACSSRWESHLQSQTLTLNQSQIEYYRFGKGSPILFVEGYLTDVSSWDERFLHDLSQDHEVIVYNHRDVGRSKSLHPKAYLASDLAEDADQLILALHLYKPAVLGISMGGMIAQALAIEHPEDLSKLILINTAIAGDEAIHPSQATEDALLHMPNSELGRFRIAVHYFFPKAARPKMAYALWVYRFQPNDLLKLDPSKVREAQGKVVIAWSKDNVAAQQIRNLSLPVLILNGGADEVLPSKNSDVLAKRIPLASLKRYPDGGHAMIYQYPDAMAQDVLDFLNH